MFVAEFPAQEAAGVVRDAPQPLLHRLCVFFRPVFFHLRLGGLRVLLTFLAFFMTEVLTRRVIHPMQYLLVGLALVLFFSLLLSLSEHIAFGAAYLAASALMVVMIGTPVRTATSATPRPSARSSTLPPPPPATGARPAGTASTPPPKPLLKGKRLF